MSGSGSIVSDVPQWSVLGLNLLNVFISIVNSGIYHALCKFADGTTLSNAVNRLEGQYVIQGDLESLKQWAL